MKVWSYIQIAGMVIGSLLITSLFFEFGMIIWALIWLFVIGAVQYLTSIIMIFRSKSKSMFRRHGILSTAYLSLLILFTVMTGIGELFLVGLIPAYFLAFYYTFLCLEAVKVHDARILNREFIVNQNSKDSTTDLKPE